MGGVSTLLEILDQLVHAAIGSNSNVSTLLEILAVTATGPRSQGCSRWVSTLLEILVR